MGGGWYGPLVDIAEARAYVGHYVQLVALVLQCQPPEKVQTSKGTEVIKSALQVGDNTSLHFKVSLWKEHACHEFWAGDILFLQNLKVTEFRGQVEATSVQWSRISILVKRYDLLCSRGSEKAVALCQYGPATKMKLKLVMDWAEDTQLTLLSFLAHHPVESVRKQKHAMEDYSSKQSRIQRHGIRSMLSGNETRKCSSIAEVCGILESCFVEFSAYVGDICLPVQSKNSNRPLGSDGWILCSKNLHGKDAECFLKELTCIGCEWCGYPLQPDHNGVYGSCQCSSGQHFARNSEAQLFRNAENKNVGWIFRPFILHIWDQSATMSLNVKHTAAVQLFASISAESVSHSLQKKCDSTEDQQGSMLGCHRSEQASSSSRRAGKPNFGLLLILLLRCILTRDKNSPFTFRVLCHSQNEKWDFIHSPFNLISFHMPRITINSQKLKSIPGVESSKLHVPYPFNLVPAWHTK
eukprot:c27849_g1_i1 orf=1121-2521(+)